MLRIELSLVDQGDHWFVQLSRMAHPVQGMHIVMGEGKMPKCEFDKDHHSRERIICALLSAVDGITDGEDF